MNETCWPLFKRLISASNRSGCFGLDWIALVAAWRLVMQRQGKL